MLPCLMSRAQKHYGNTNKRINNNDWFCHRVCAIPTDVDLWSNSRFGRTVGTLVVLSKVLCWQVCRQRINKASLRSVISTKRVGRVGVSHRLRFAACLCRALERLQARGRSLEVWSKRARAWSRGVTAIKVFISKADLSQYVRAAPACRYASHPAKSRAHAPAAAVLLDAMVEVEVAVVVDEGSGHSCVGVLVTCGLLLNCENLPRASLIRNLKLSARRDGVYWNGVTVVTGDGLEHAVHDCWAGF